MRFQVPQNLDVPDTIFLGLDFRQLIYLGGAVGLLVFLFLFTNIWVTLLAGVPVALLAGLLSFFSYNNQKFVTIFQSLIRFFSRKKMYVWRQGVSDVAVQHTAQKGGSTDGEFVSPDSSLQRQKVDKVREMSSNLVFSDDEGDAYDDLDTVL
ncbi:MAG: PrgI family protein [Candidatus Kaiserbacteria bacterium]|nr:PrgI family protein [Candidatus Kaiserbacteria bacterium]